MSECEVLRWGICSAGKISNDFVSCLNSLPRSEHKVASVAAKSLESAKKFAEAHNIENAYGSYEELAKDSSIDIVYIGVIHPYHYSSAKLMLEGGKHVLCEKPLCMNVGETKSLLELAKSKELFLMEGIWTRAFPAVRKVQELIKNGAIGKVQHFRANICLSPENIPPRCTEKELGGGATMDIGIYAIQWAQLVFREKPICQTTCGYLWKSGTDAESHTILKYSNNRHAILSYGFTFAGPCDAIICGTEGCIKICEPCWAPEKLVLCKNSQEGEYIYKNPEINTKFNFRNGAGMVFEAMEVRKCILNGLKESPLVTSEMSLEIAEIMQKSREQLGYTLPQDKQ